MQICFEECQFDVEARRLWRRGEPVHLTPKAFDLLRLLIESRPRALSKDELRGELWPDVVVDEANLKNLVAEIRAALGAANVIRTVHRYGYAFEARVEDAPPAEARLIGESGAHRLSAGENVIGRAIDCEVVIDLALAAASGIRPVLEPARLDAAEDLVELRFAYQERVVLHLDLHALGVEEIKRHLVADLDAEERAEGLGRGQTEDFGEKRGSRLRILRMHDGVVELDRHGGPI